MLKASIQWREILLGKLVAEFMLDQPKININLQQLQSEAASTAPLKERGWQKAVEDIYPLKINTVKIKDASVTYIDQDPKRPLVLSHLNLQANNIRNIHLPDQVYPSSFHLDTAIFGTGHGTVDGAANFLAEPYPGIKGGCAGKGAARLFQADDCQLEPLHPWRGAPGLRRRRVRAEGEDRPPEESDDPGDEPRLHPFPTYRSRRKKTCSHREKAARKLGNKPGILIRADQVSLTGCTLGMVNKWRRNRTGVFLADTELHLSNFSNQFAQGPAQARLKAKFMGSGTTTASAEFSAGKGGTRFRSLSQN